MATLSARVLSPVRAIGCYQRVKKSHSFKRRAYVFIWEEKNLALYEVHCAEKCRRIHVPFLKWIYFFSPGTRGMSLGVKGLPVYEEGEEPKTEIKEKYGERERRRAASPWGERDRRAMTRAVMRPLFFSLMFNHEPVGADPRLRHFAFH